MAKGGAEPAQAMEAAALKARQRQLLWLQLGGRGGGAAGCIPISQNPKPSSPPFLRDPGEKPRKQSPLSSGAKGQSPRQGTNRRVRSMWGWRILCRTPAFRPTPTPATSLAAGTWLPLIPPVTQPLSTIFHQLCSSPKLCLHEDLGIRASPQT